MSRYFISQPMRGRTGDEIRAERDASIKAIYEMDACAEIIDTYFSEPLKMGGWNEPLFYLSLALREMAKADVAVFIGEWWKARGCKIEHECAEQYGIKILYGVDSIGFHSFYESSSPNAND